MIAYLQSAVKPRQFIDANGGVIAARGQVAPLRGVRQAGNRAAVALELDEGLAAQQIPDEARRVIGQYLDAIHRSEDAKRSRLAGLLEIETGYDSNVNFGSSSGQWVLADGTAVIPLGVSLPRSSAVFAVALGLNWTVPMGGGWQWTTGGRAS